MTQLAERLRADRHSWSLSLVLHLLPGVLIVAAYLLITEPLAHAIGLPSFIGWAASMCVTLLPFELGLLLWLGPRKVLHFRGWPLSRKRLAALVVPLIVWFLVISTVLTPLDTVVYKALFTWLPFDGAGTSVTAYLDGYPHAVMVGSLAACIPLTGLLFPIVEELYFRGFLMSRLPVPERWAPLVSSVLFSAYHLWSPWVFLSRITYLLPAFVLVRRTKDLRVSIGAHAGTAFFLQVAGTIALFFNVVS